MRALSQDRPDWINDFKREDSTYKYYVGRSTPKSSESLALKEATIDAMESASGQNFGLSIETTTLSEERSETLDHLKSAKTQSSRVQLKGFEELNYYTDSRQIDGRTVFEAYVYYRYKKTEIESEKLRLAQLALLPKIESESAIGSDENFADMGSLTIDTLPKNVTAKVILDDETWGKTPLIIKNAIVKGSHELKVDHPKFEIFESRIVIYPGQTIPVHAVLIPAFGILHINVNPQDAQVSINGKSINPDYIKLPAGELRTISFKAKGYLSKTTEVILSRSEETHLVIALEPIPAPEPTRAPASTSNQQTQESQSEVKPRVDIIHLSPSIFNVFLKADVATSPVKNEVTTSASGGLYGLGARFRPLWVAGVNYGYFVGNASDDKGNASSSYSSGSSSSFNANYKQTVIGLPLFFSGLVNNTWESAFVLTPEWITTSASWNATRANYNSKAGNYDKSKSSGSFHAQSWGIRFAWEGNSLQNHLGSPTGGFGIDLSIVSRPLNAPAKNQGESSARLGIQLNLGL